MQSPSCLVIELLSDTTFGSGQSEYVDIEIEHDEYGLPIISGRNVKGLLRETWINMHIQFPEYGDAAGNIFGRRESIDASSILNIGNATVDKEVIEIVRHAIQERRITQTMVLDSLTDVRYQTALERNGSPREESLRSKRVLERGTILTIPLHWVRTPTNDELRVLLLCILAARHGGMNRNRGLGHIRITLPKQDEMIKQLLSIRGNSY